MKKIVTVGMIILSLFVVTGCGCDKKDDKKTEEPQGKESVNTNKGIIKEQTVDGITFKNAILVLDGEGMSNFKITVLNESGKPKQVDTFKVTFKGKTGDVLLETYGYVGYQLQDKDSTEIQISLDQDMANATDVVYELLS